MENNLVNKTEEDFESIKHIDENGIEFWYARELMGMLEYSKWGNFTKVIDKAKEACENSNVNISDHFANVGKIVKAGATSKNIGDFKLTRYACYLIAQNGDSRKKAIALAQTYFAVQTRKQEITRQEYEQLSEDEKRLYTRQNVKDKNKYLFNTAKSVGVKNYGKFNNYGYRGLYNNDFVSLNLDSVAGILHRGGTILYSSNKDNLFDYLVEENGVMVKKDVSDVANENLKREGVDVLVVIGGDGTLTSARDFARKGVNVIGVPKTIDNDLSSTDVTFGFNTAIDVATEALDRLHTTAESHHRIMICEVMGRNAGWIALESGIAGSADVILLPEIPYDIKKIEEKVRQREAEGRNFTIIVVAEGAKPKDGDVVVSKIVSDSPDPIRLGGIGNKLADDLEKLIKDHEVRCTVLGHVQRGGNTCTYDRILSTRYGVAAMELIIEGKFGQMVCLKGDTITNDTLENVIGQNTKKVNPEGELVQVAKKIGITFAE